MKIHKSGLLVLTTIFFFNSCLKDELADNNETGVVIDNNVKTAFFLGPPAGSKIINLEYSNVDTTFGVATIRIATDKPVASEVKVTLVQNPNLLTAYNTANGTNYITPDAGLYTIPSLAVTIPAGQTDGSLMIKLKSADVATGEYGFGFSIAGVSDATVKVSGNFNNQVVLIGVKNKYDGRYDLRIKTTGWAAYGIADGSTADWPAQEIYMVTAGANTVKMYDNSAFGAFIQVAFTSGMGQTGFGATQPKFIFDVTTNKLTDVVNDAPAGDPRNRQFTINTAVTDSRYDPATKTIYAAYILTQNGRPAQFIFDTLSKQSPR